MRTYTKKKGRIAIAWLVIVTMVFATMYTPFAVAEDSPYKTNVVFSNTHENIDEDQITSTTVPATADYIFFKQAGAKQGEHYLWTPTQITDTDLLDDILYYVRTHDSSLKNDNDGKYDDEYWDTFDNFIWGYDGEAGTFNDSPYGLTLQTIEDVDYIVIEWETDTISHINFGEYDIEEPSGTAQIKVQKEFLDSEENPITLTGGEFQFELYAAEDDWSIGDEPIGQPVSNDSQGWITFPEIKYGEADIDTTKHYIIKEVVPDDTGDIIYDLDPIKVTVSIGLDDNDQIETIVNIFGEKDIFTNLTKEKEEEYGSIEVTKTVIAPNGAPLNKSMTFIFALFDEDGNIYEEYEPISVTVDPSVALTAKGTFIELDLKKVYTVYEVYQSGDDFLKIETDEDGNVTTEGIPVKTIKYTNNVDIEVNSETPAEVSVENTLPSEEGGLLGSILVTKTVTLNDKPYAGKLTFYVGLFADKELKNRIDMNTIPMNGLSEKTVSFDDLEAGTYYIAETDADGNPLTGTPKELGFEITVNGEETNLAEVELVDDQATVALVNNFIKSKEEFPLTGDDSNMSLWLFLAMLGVAGALAPFAFRKKEVTND